MELGSGRGKGCFWMAHFVKRSIGVEWIPSFVYLGRLICWLFRIRNVQFRKEDLQTTDLKEATVVYLYGMWPKRDWPKQIKVITTSEPLEGFEVVKSFSVWYPWGATKAFLQVKR